MRSALVVLLLVVVGACTSSESGLTSPVGPDTTMAASTPTVSSGGSSTTMTSAAPQSAFEMALAATGAAGSYEFGGQLVLFQGSGQAVTALHGWVYGDDRLIVTEVGGQVTETLVSGGEATITADGASKTVALGEVNQAPSIDVLDLIDVRNEQPGKVTGVIPASIVNGPDAQGFVDVTVWFDAVVVAYSVVDPNGNWELSMTFSNVGTFEPPVGP